MTEITLQAEQTELKLFTVNFPDKNALYQAYMAFIKDGGLFIATTEFVKLGQKIKANVSLPDNLGKYSILGEVVWITPMAAQGRKTTGFGLRFLGEEAVELRNKIEAEIPNSLNSEKRTETM